VEESELQKEVRLASRRDAFAKEVRQSIQNGAYTYDLRTTLAVRGAGGCLTAKKGAWCGAIFVDLFHFLLLFVTVRNFYKLLFTVETRVKFVIFCYFFTVCNFLKLLFTVEKGQGLYCIHCARGEKVRLDFFPFFFFC
jgi:hypothetical protein